jgi:hypothetical protein
MGATQHNPFISQFYYRGCQCIFSFLLSLVISSTSCLYFLRPICAGLLRNRPRISPRACRAFSKAFTSHFTHHDFRSYLLGSGGTLMFDVTIVTQSFIYRPPSRTRASRSFSREVTVAEEEGLLPADDVEEPYTPRRRLPVTTEETEVRD